MSVLPDLLPILLKMIQKSEGGTVNLCNPGVISHNEVLEMYRDIVDPSFTWKNFTDDEQNGILKARRSNNYLETARLERSYTPLPIHRAVRAVLTDMATSRA